MHLEKRIELLIRLGEYMLTDGAEWRQVKDRAEEKNNWFTRKFIDYAASSIANNFLSAGNLRSFLQDYHLPDENTKPKNIGLVMAGNIPLVGFHDWMCIFLTGHQATVKLSSKDELLIPHLIHTLEHWASPDLAETSFQPLLKGCDAYVATGSNNSARYFDYYFSKYPHIIRHNRTSVGILTGNETIAELEMLADDVHLFFGLGCRNVTKIYVPKGYDFVPLLEAFRKYAYFADHNKYKNNYDYQLALHLINNIYYMTNGSTLLSENTSWFSPISQLNYEFYSTSSSLKTLLTNTEEIQSIVGQDFTPFGSAQSPAISDFADGVDTMLFLKGI